METRQIKIVAILLIAVSIIVFLGFMYINKSKPAISSEPSRAYSPAPNISHGPIISFNFDDGFTSAYTIGMPILEAYGFKSSHYIVINRIGEKSYMTRRQILDLQDRGHEIGAHSRTHEKLTEMSLSKARREILGSKEDLIKKGVVKISTFVYPDGYFNDEIAKLVEESGYSGARITNPGLNDITTDPYKLFYLGMNSEISFETVKIKIDEAIEKKKWLIMVFHRIDEVGFENVSSELLQKTVDYVKEKNVPVVTTTQGLFILRNIP